MPVAGRNGVICSLVSPDGARSMAADRGAAVALRPEEIDPVWLDGCDHLFVSGYALLREPVRSAALFAVELGRAQGAVVSVDLATWSAIRDAGVAEFRERCRRSRRTSSSRTRTRSRSSATRLPARTGS